MKGYPRPQTPNPRPQFLAYRNRPYRVLYLGPTKFGKRAHLQFLDRSSDFWVDAKLTSPTNPVNDLVGACIECFRPSPQLSSDGYCPRCARAIIAQLLKNPAPQET